MKNFFLLLFAGILFSCAGDKNVELFNDIYFDLHEGERVVDITTAIHADFEAIVEGKRVQIPLFRYVENTDYDIYIGLPYTSTIALISSELPAEEYRLVSDSLSSNFKAYVTDKHYFSEYVYEDYKSKIYILATTASKSIADSLFNYDGLSKRIYKK